ncbi:MAG: nuclear transport factor 2 family protein [Candidatus Zixiibacteriota bacterium]|nr:MAG: nuclear transport factor 2 family protein [candidate division Zixibacteria bacterium]
MHYSEIVKNLFQDIESGNVREAGKYLTDDFTFSGPTPTPVNKREYLDLHAALLKAFPDWKFNLQNLQDQGRNRISGSVQITGTHTGTLTLPDLPTVKPTNRKIRLPKERFECTLEGDKITEFKVEKSPDGGVSGIFQQLEVELPEGALA